MRLTLIDLHYIQISFMLLLRRAKFELETEGKITLLETFIQWFATQSKLSLIFTKTLLFPHKTNYFSSNSHDAHKNADGSSKFNVTKLNP